MRKFLLLVLGILAFSIQIFAQNRTITGKVADASGQPIVGASVIVTGTNIGTTTSQDGSFSLSVPQKFKTLTISSVNMVAQEIAVRSGGIAITLASKAGDLDEVVCRVIGSDDRRAILEYRLRLSAEDIVSVSGYVAATVGVGSQMVFIVVSEDLGESVGIRCLREAPGVVIVVKCRAIERVGGCGTRVVASLDFGGRTSCTGSRLLTRDETR